MWATEDDTPQVRNEWTSWLRHQDIEAIGWGWITLRNSGHAEPSFRADSLPGQQITGPAVAEYVSRLVAALVEGCDGSQSLREQLAELAASRDVDPAGLIDAAGQAVPRLVEHGYLRPVRL
jgi:hypothetical protein